MTGQHGGDELFQQGAKRLQMGMRLGVQQVQGGASGSHGQRIAGQRTRLIDGPEWRQLLHYVLGSAVGAHR